MLGKRTRQFSNYQRVVQGLRNEKNEHRIAVQQRYEMVHWFRYPIDDGQTLIVVLFGASSVVVPHLVRPYGLEVAMLWPTGRVS
ncbi:hypothetical protein GN958_ATG00539 [Phytophthora infestans]|uniref:Uncharacterized protein n=1 Tax=Phytophthora infestans TaxID=4787 RepID=A0A8S9VBW8_PHYIN|nr:hypothetical protein GN958_ATG00539 [Phytophthora infestans]